MRLVTATAAALLTATFGSTAFGQAPAAPPAQAPAAPAAPAQAQQPMFSTTKVEGTDNVYIFRYQGHQSMFIVTKDGVIATDPIGLYRPQAVTTYIDEIKKVTNAPIKYVIYSHHHYDHISGGKPFKDAGAKFVAHKRAKERLLELKNPDVVIPDQVVGDKGSIKLGGTTLELTFVGNNHSDNLLVMRLPKEKLIFVVDAIPIQGLAFRNIPDNTSPIAYENSIKKILAMDWDRMIPGHPGPGGRLGTKQDAQFFLTYLQDLSAEVKKAADANKCWDAAMREVKLPKYENLPNYASVLPMNIERYCYWWGRGY
jgi:glyoxylase-like metal-dependent hydrolase (beta-lactamase superfamily II)